MTRFPVWFILISPLIAFASDSIPTPQNEFIQKRLKAIRPELKELRWKSLKWHTNLASAQKEAQKEKKPLFIIFTDGDFETANC